MKNLARAQQELWLIFYHMFIWMYSAFSAIFYKISELPHNDAREIPLRNFHLLLFKVKMRQNDDKGRAVSVQDDHTG